jgi:hypothetical protein
LNDEQEVGDLALVPVGEANPLDHATVSGDIEKQRQENRTLKENARTFLIEESSLSRIIMSRRVVQPQMLMMKQYLQQSGPKWDIMQMHSLSNTGSREYRIVRAATNTHEKQFFERLWAIFNSTWGAMPGKTVRANCQVFRMAARSGATCYELLVKRHSVYPYKLFRLLVDEELVEEIISDSKRPCCLDHWSKSFLDVYGSDATKLLSDESRQELLHMALVTPTDTAGIERRHASNRRRATSRPHASPMHVSELAAWQMVSCAGPAFRPNLKSDSAARKQTSEQGNGGAQKRKHSHRWGPWRTAVALETSAAWARGSVRFGNSMSEVAERYREKTAAEKEDLADVGDWMRMARSNEGQQHTREGLRQRQTLTKMRSLEKALLNSLHGASEGKELSVIARPSSAPACRLDEQVRAVAQAQKAIAREASRKECLKHLHVPSKFSGYLLHCDFPTSC